MFIERRQSPRADILCKISTIFGDRLLVFNSHSENAGVGGIMTILEEKLHISTIVDLELLLSGREKALKCKGQIVWVEEINPKQVSPCLFKTGIKFINMSDSDRAEMRKFMEG